MAVADVAPTASLAAIVLAGGRARRMGGADKPALRIGGHSLVATAAVAALGCGASQLVIVGPPRDGLETELRSAAPGGPAARARAIAVSFTQEEPPGAGPVPALRAGLAVVKRDWFVLLAADLPFIDERAVRNLLGAATASAGAVLTDNHGRPQWLVSCWRTAVLRAALDGYGGDALWAVLEPLHPALVTGPASADEPPAWLDCDTPRDVAAAIGWAARAASPGRGPRASRERPSDTREGQDDEHAG